MFEWIEPRPSREVAAAEYQRLLGYPRNHQLDGRASELAEAARKWFSAHGRPWIYAREIAPFELRPGKVCVAGTEFSSKRLHGLLAEARAHSTVLVAVSAGQECEEHARQLWEEGKPDEFYFLKVFGSAVVEHLVTVASGRICGWADENQMAVLPHFSPGYSGWDIADQPRLLDLFPKHCTSVFPGELEVLESGMLRPEKSLLAVFGLTRDLDKARHVSRLIPCERCSLPHCQYRRAVYKRS